MNTDHSNEKPLPDSGLEVLAYELQRQESALRKCRRRNFDDFVAHVLQFRNATEAGGPWYTEESAKVDRAHIAALKERGYPEEYLRWARKFSHCSIQAEVAMPAAAQVVAGIAEGGFYHMLARNGYLYFANDPAGNAYVFDTNLPGSPITLLKRDSYITADRLHAFYTEMRNLRYDKQARQYVDSAGRPLGNVFDESGQYRLDAPHIRRYLRYLVNPDTGGVVTHSKLIDFLIYRAGYGLRRQLAPHYGKLIKIASAHQESGDWRRGIAVLNALIEVLPGVQEGYNNRAYTYRVGGELELARQDAETAILMKPEDGLAHGTLAEILFDLGEENAFFESLSAALQHGMDPNLMEPAMMEKYREHARLISIPDEHPNLMPDKLALIVPMLEEALLELYALHKDDIAAVADAVNGISYDIIPHERYAAISFRKPADYRTEEDFSDDQTAKYSPADWELYSLLEYRSCRSEKFRACAEFIFRLFEQIQESTPDYDGIQQDIDHLIYLEIAEAVLRPAVAEALRNAGMTLAETLNERYDYGVEYLVTDPDYSNTFNYCELVLTNRQTEAAQSKLTLRRFEEAPPQTDEPEDVPADSPANTEFEKMYGSFMEFMQDAQQYTTADALLIADYKGVFMDPKDDEDIIIGIWRQFGFCSYKQGLFTLLNPRDFNEVARRFPEVSAEAEVFARTATGCLFLWEMYSFGRTIAFLNIHTGEKKIISTSFNVLWEWDLPVEYFWKEDCNGKNEFAALKKFETIPPDQCAGYKLALALGGTKSVSNMQLFDFKTHLEILAQMHS